MKKKKSSIYLIILIFAMIFLKKCIFHEHNERDYNAYRCETKKIEIIGTISWIYDKTNYTQIRLNNVDKIYSFDIEDIKYVKGFPKKWVSYEIGDSIIKEANSKEVIVKRGNDYAIYILDCDD